MIRRPFRRPTTVRPTSLGLVALEDRTVPTLVGRLDPLFDGDGLNSFGTFVGTDDIAAAVAFQPDGRFVVAGTVVNPGGNEDIQILRFNANGTPDNTFAGTGRVFVAFDLGGTNSDRARAVSIQSNGKIVVAGYATTASNKDMAVIRLNANGGLDSTFDGDGKLTFDLGGSDDEVAAVAIQPTGEILLAGYQGFSGSDRDFALVRLNTTGSFDASFDGDGKRNYAFDDGDGNTDEANAIALQPDGKIVLAGYARVNGQGKNFAVIRALANGARDTSFGSNGEFTTDFSNGVARDDFANGVAIQADGNIVIAGVGDAGTPAPNNSTDFGFVRMTSLGKLDTTFDGDGKLLVPFDFSTGTKDDGANTVFIQPDGRIVAAGFASFSGTDKDFAVTRRNTDGSPDTTFKGSIGTPDVPGNAHYFFDSGGGDTDVALAAALDSSGRIVLVGTASTDTNGNELVLVRAFGQEVPLVVSTTADEADGDISAGKLSLREAITLANLDPDGNAITFATGLTGTITLGSDLPAITGNTTISGPGASKLAVSGNDLNRVFVVNDQTATLIDVSISGLTLTRGRATSGTGGAAPTLGGAIFSLENLTLTNVAVTNSTVNGAIYHSAGTLTVSNGTFSGNQNNNSAAAILSDGATLVVSSSTFTNNSGNGRGAIFTSTAATISNSAFTGNAATGAFGGGGAIYHRAGTLTVTGGSFTSNSANFQGGAINTEEGTLAVTGSTFAGNQSTNKGGAIFSAGESTLSGITVTGGSASSGAGLFNAIATAKMTVANSTISGNTGFAPGIRNNLGTVSISGSTIAGNTGTTDGGLSNFQGTMTVVNTTVSGNSVTGKQAGVSNSGALTMMNVTITNNRSDSDGSGDSPAGGLTNLVAGTVTMTNTIVAGNFHGAAGADLAADIIDEGTTGKIDVANSANNLIGDAATAGGFANGTNGNRVGVNAGLLPLANNGGSTQTHALLAGSPAVNAGAASALSLDQRGAPRSIGGAVDIGAFELVIPANLVVDNAGDADDGNFAAGQLTLREAIQLANARAGVDTIAFAASLTAGGSAKIVLTASLPDLTDGVNINGPGANLLVIDGANAFEMIDNAVGVTSSVSNVTLTRGLALNGGGASNFGTLTLTNCTITANAATIDTASNGGGVENNQGTLTIVGCTISNNTANQVGGGVNNFRGTVQIINSTISGNSAKGSGGGVFNNNGTVSLTHTTITGNRADFDNNGVGKGGGLILFNGTETLNNSIVAGNFRGNGSTPDDINAFTGTQTIETANNNIIGDAATSGGLTDGPNGNVVGVAVADVINTTLANNGGPTLTHALNPNGPALGGGSKAFMTATDQRGFPRPADPTFFPDIGAVEPQLLALVPPTLPSGTINTPYNQTLTASLAGLPAGTTFTFQIAGGSLPAGLALGSTGVISGTPTVAGTFNFTVATLASTGDLALPTSRTITVPALNSPPSISDIANQTGKANVAIGPIGFTVADDLTPAGALSLTAMSSNPSLVPINNVTFGGSAGNRTVTVTPANGQSGTATITVTVTDGNGATANDSFTVTIADAPGPLLVGFSQFAAGADVGGFGLSSFNADGTVRFTLTPFSNFAGGIRTAAADFNGDGVADIVAGTGPGRATRVVVIDGVSKSELFAVDPFESTFTGGVYVAAGDVDGDGVPDLAITPDEGGGPRVDMYGGGKSFAKIVSFFGIDDPNFRGGARASIADMTGDGVGDLIVVAGFGGGPRVAGFDGTTLSKTPEKIFGDFFAFEETLRNGIFVTAGDLNGDGFADLICGGGPGGGPRVLVFDGKSLLSNQYVNLANFFGGDPDSRGGIRLTVKDLDGDNRADLVVGSGSKAGSRLTAYLGTTIAAAGTPPSSLDFDAFAGFAGGIFVG